MTPTTAADDVNCTLFAFEVAARSCANEVFARDSAYWKLAPSGHATHLEIVHLGAPFRKIRNHIRLLCLEQRDLVITHHFRQCGSIV